MKKKVMILIAAAIMALAGGLVVSSSANAAPATTEATASVHCSMTPVRIANRTVGAAEVSALVITELAGDLDSDDGIPDNATSADMTVTSLTATANTFLTFWPAEGHTPVMSDVPGTNQVTQNHTDPTQTTSFNVGTGSTTVVGPGVVVGMFNHIGTMHVLIDVDGYTVPVGSSC